MVTLPYSPFYMQKYFRTKPSNCTLNHLFPLILLKTDSPSRIVNNASTSASV